MKQTKCRVCKSLYTKWSISQKTCPKISCAMSLVELDKEKKTRKEYKAEKIRLKTRREWISDVQKVFNACIRERDEGKACISCQRMHKGQIHAGHYLSTGARPELRFNEDNCHSQCAPCNNHLSGNIALYRINLIKKIGLERVEWLEGPHEPAKWTIPELIELHEVYKAKLKELKNGMHSD